MNGELWRSEVCTYGFMILNGVAVCVGWVWASRRGLFTDVDGSVMKGLDLSHGTAKENTHGQRLS